LSNTGQKFSVNNLVVGAISYKAGAIFPYRFVTSIWWRLLEGFPGRLDIETATPVHSVEIYPTLSPSAVHSDPVYPYCVNTSRGVIHARHVVHATNAYLTNLVPGFRGKITSLLGHMTAQRPGKGFPDLNGDRSWSFIFGVLFDYITQRPTVGNIPGEIMCGGGFGQSEQQGLDFVGVYDDSKLNALTVAHLEGIMPTLFAPNWGEDAAGGRMKNVWSGVVAASADMLPFVGKLDYRLTGRRAEVKTVHRDVVGTDQDMGEWVSAVYTGDGMVWAWLCGMALGTMIANGQRLRPQGDLEKWFPPELYPTYERRQKLDIADLAGLLM
jgi:glycine/D-amino acid oxidase-like deaminating enzyme